MRIVFVSAVAEVVVPPVESPADEQPVRSGAHRTSALAIEIPRWERFIFIPFKKTGDILKRLKVWRSPR